MGFVVFAEALRPIVLKFPDNRFENLLISHRWVPHRLSLPGLTILFPASAKPMGTFTRITRKPCPFPHFTGMKVNERKKYVFKSIAVNKVKNCLVGC